MIFRYGKAVGAVEKRRISEWSRCWAHTWSRFFFRNWSREIPCIYKSDLIVVDDSLANRARFCTRAHSSTRLVYGSKNSKKYIFEHNRFGFFIYRNNGKILSNVEGRLEPWGRCLSFPDITKYKDYSRWTIIELSWCKTNIRSSFFNDLLTWVTLLRNYVLKKFSCHLPVTNKEQEYINKL